MSGLTTTANASGALQFKLHQVTINVKDDQPAVFNLGEHEISHFEDGRFGIIWQNPRAPLQLVFVTPFTRKKQPFVVCINSDKPGAISVAYTDDEGKPAEHPLTDKYIKRPSNDNYEVIYKLVPTPGHTDDVTIDYVFAAA